MSNGDKGSTKQDSNKKGIAGASSDEGDAKAGSGGGGGTPSGTPKPKKP